MIIKNAALRVLAWMPAYLALVMVGGCGQEVPQPDEVVGRYILNKGQGEGVIELHPDGQYIHSFTPSRGTTLVDSGSWNIEILAEEPRVVFSDFRFHLEERPKGTRPSRAPGYWPASIERTLSGRMQLIVNDDVGWAYIQVKPSKE